MYIFIGLQGCVGDLRVFRKWTLYSQAWCHDLFSKAIGLQKGFSPCLLVDNGYPLLSWPMSTQHKDGNHTSLKSIYNKMHRKRRSILKNAFGILKDTFSWVSWWDIFISIIPYLIICFVILHTICYSVVMKLMWNTFCICCKKSKIHKINMLLKNTM